MTGGVRGSWAQSPVPPPPPPPLGPLVTERVTCQFGGPSASASHICVGQLDGKWLLRCAGKEFCTAIVFGPQGAKIKWTSNAFAEYQTTTITGANKSIQLSTYPRTASVVRGPWIGDVTRTGATVRWETDGAAQPVVLNPGAGFVWTTGTSVALPGGRHRHSVRLPSLTAGIQHTVQLGDVSTPTWATFRTAPLGSPPFRFVAFGDYQCGEPGLLQKLLSQTGPALPHFFVSTGDMIDSYSGCNWDSFFGSANFLSQGALYPALGNNDPIPDWLDLFAFPGSVSASRPYYAFTYSNTRFLFLYSGPADTLAAGQKLFPPRSANVDCAQPATQTDWVSCELRAAGQSAAIRNVVVVLHMPPYTYPQPGGGTHLSNQDEQQNLVPLLESAPKVRLVLAGHNHFYQRILKSYPIPHKGKVHYLVIGGGGASLYNPTTSPASFPEIKKQQRDFHFVSVEVSGTTLSIQVKAYRSVTQQFSVIETFQL